MVTRIISTVVLILIGCASFAFGMISCSTTNKQGGEPVQTQAAQTQGSGTEAAAQTERERSSSPIGAFFSHLLIPSLDADKGQQKTLADKSTQILSVWETLKTANGAVSILMSGQAAGSASLAPLDSVMGKLSDKISFSYSLIFFFKVILMLAHYIVFLALIPICVIVVIVVLWTSKEKQSAFKSIVASAIIVVAVAAALPVSFLLSTVMEEKILAHDVTNLVESIDAKGHSAQTLERNAAAARTSSAHIATAKTLGNGIVTDVTNYYIIFSFLYIVIPILIVLFFVFLSIYFIKLIKTR
ncbi:MAG: hypothetical protein FWC01_01865 [Treponema sp.]|nr:hypothetical protein [Treponema sp.]MCL2238246.1 hypothetical protein [Treponema sp.]